MPTRVWHDLTALLDDRTTARCVALAEARHTGSHDGLPRWVQADGSGPRLLDLACRTLGVWQRGALLSDAPVLAHPWATAIESLAWGSSSQDHRPVSGRSLVLLIWTAGPVRLPLGLRRWPQGGPSTSRGALA